MAYQPVGRQTALTNLSSVRSVTLGSTSNGLLVQALTQNVRFTFDNTDPATSLGFRITAGSDPVLIPAAAGSTIKFLQEAATAELQYQEVIA